MFDRRDKIDVTLAKGSVPSAGFVALGPGTAGMRARAVGRRLFAANITDIRSFAALTESFPGGRGITTHGLFEKRGSKQDHRHERIA
jgi:hypothetical protein